MAYTISNTDGTTLLILADNTVDQTTTSLALIGKNVSNYGKYVNNNFVKLLENFANTYGNAPSSPVTGQLWYNTTAQRMFVYDTDWQPVSGAIVSSSQPGLLNSGDFWWNSADNQLKIYNNNTLYTIGPAFPQAVGSNGWTLPASSLVDQIQSATQDVTLLYNYGTTVGAVSSSRFVMQPQAAQTYFNTSSVTLVEGMTINGDLQVLGQMSSYYLSTSVVIDYLNLGAGTNYSISTIAGYTAQNNAIINLLNQIYPLSSSTSYHTATNTVSKEVGVVPGSEARVICQWTNAYNQISGTQVRRFVSVLNTSSNNLNGGTWKTVDVYPTQGTLSTATGLAVTNIVYTTS